MLKNWLLVQLELQSSLTSWPLDARPSSRSLASRFFSDLASGEARLLQEPAATLFLQPITVAA